MQSVLIISNLYVFPSCFVSFRNFPLCIYCYNNGITLVSFILLSLCCLDMIILANLLFTFDYSFFLLFVILVTCETYNILLLPTFHNINILSSRRNDWYIIHSLSASHARKPTSHVQDYNLFYTMFTHFMQE